MWAIFHNNTLLDLVSTELAAWEYVNSIEKGGAFNYIYVAHLQGLKEHLKTRCATY